jgi:hypothetical protein
VAPLKILGSVLVAQLHSQYLFIETLIGSNPKRTEPEFRFMETTARRYRDSPGR